MNQTLLITISILVLIALLFILVAINSRSISNSKKVKLYEKLGDLKGRTESEDSSIRRDSIIKLDNLLSKALQYRYGNDKTCGDNLKIAQKLFKKKEYQDIWDVHKIRNNIVHNDLEISKNEAKDAYKVYKISITKILK